MKRGAFLSLTHSIFINMTMYSYHHSESYFIFKSWDKWFFLITKLKIISLKELSSQETSLALARTELLICN